VVPGQAATVQEPVTIAIGNECIIDHAGQKMQTDEQRDRYRHQETQQHQGGAPVLRARTPGFQLRTSEGDGLELIDYHVRRFPVRSYRSRNNLSKSPAAGESGPL